MRTVLILSLGDIIGLIFFAIIAATIGYWFLQHKYHQWKQSPNRWWNKRK